MRFLGVNAAGLRCKLKTFKKVLTELKPSVFFIEETKYKDVGRIKFENYIIFELVRKDKDGGGLALGCDKDLRPAWVREGNDLVEALSVEIYLKDIKIRCCVAYGCQENDTIDRKEAFWSYLDEEVLQADSSGSGFVLHFDGNLWAGNKIIPGDPRLQNRNGKLFQEFLERHPHLSVVNSLPQCEGVITRSRVCNGVIEESVLDFFVVCDKVLPFVNKMVIDDKKEYILTNFQAARGGGKATNSDHFTQYLDLDLDFVSEKPERDEFYNFKNTESQAVFRKLTSETEVFTNCFMDGKPLEKQVENWLNTLHTFCQKSFKKIRVKKRNIQPLKPNMSRMINERNNMIKNHENEDKVHQIDQKIAQFEAEENRKIIVDNFSQFAEDPENIDRGKMWKLLGKLWPKNGISIPTAKRNHKGRIISAPGELKKLLAKEYKDRLRLRPFRPDMKNMKKRKTKIFKLKMRLAKKNNSSEYTMENLEAALNNLKRKKSRDSDGLINEIFKLDVIGINLKKSLLVMFQKLKKEKLIPMLMNFANITTVPKSGSRMELKNERGIFRVSVVRSILMRMIYDIKYAIIDTNMSDCQMGGRKNKGCKNNIFILNGIIHDVMKSNKMHPVQLQIYDYQQMFDALDLKQALSDLYDVGVNDDNLVLLHQANQKIHMAVKTQSGLTERQTVRDIVLQGDTWGSIMASVQVDSIGKECIAEGHGYLYKGKLPVPFLGLVDDIIGITNAGLDAQKMNTFINVKSAEKTLQFGPKKCKSMLVGKNCANIVQSDIFVDNWKIEYEDIPDSAETKLVETFCGQIAMQRTEEQKYLGFVLSSKGDNMANIREVKKKSIGVIRKIMNKLKCLNLQKYYFECAMIFMDSMLRGSILYAADMYYNLKESELRQIERIEESYLRQVLKTTRGCPISQIYLETGQIPARFEIKKMRLMYLKNILEQNEDSQIFKFFQLQMAEPSKGDWVSRCSTDLKELGISEQFDEIKKMKKIKFSTLVKSRVRDNALQYLKKKQRSKGSEIVYNNTELADYLQPINPMPIEKKQKLFAVRNRMIQIPNNFPKSETKAKCFCGKIEDMSHVYNCKILNEEVIPSEKYENIYNGTISQQTEILKKFEQNMDKREQILKENDPPCDPLCDPRLFIDL